jgi:hypothetical protein
MCEIWTDDYPDAWTERTVTARKPHVCSGCRAAIRKGEMYLRTWCLQDGHNTTEKACADCAFVRDAFGETHAVIPWPSSLVGMLRECISEDDDDGWRMALAALLKRNRAALANKRRAR